MVDDINNGRKRDNNPLYDPGMSSIGWIHCGGIVGTGIWRKAGSLATR